jgi:hypothetical protein
MMLQDVHEIELELCVYSSFDFAMIRAHWRISKCSVGQTNSALSNAALQTSKFPIRAITSSRAS